MSKRTRFWVVTIAAVVGMTVTAELGLWQLDRAAQKETWVASMQSQAQAAVLADSDWPRINENVQQAELAVHRRIRLTGTWLQDHVVFLDNRQMNAKPGFYVLTPLRLSSGDTVVVQRGWVQRNFLNRDQLPQLYTPTDEVTVFGRLAPPPSQLYSMGEVGRTQIRQNLNWADFAEELGDSIGLLSLVQLDDSTLQADGLLREWPQVDAKLHTHYGYAAQWFALSALLALLYVWFQWIAPRRVKKN